MKATHPLALAIALLLGTSLIADDANAQRSLRDRDNRRGGEQTQPAEAFPDATRESPKPATSPRLQRQLERLQKAYEADGEDQKVIEAAEEIINSGRATPYELGIAMLMAGSAANNLDDVPRAVSYMQRAIDGNALPNDNHFNAMLILGQTYYNDQQYAKAAEVLSRMIAESGSTSADAFMLLGAAYYHQDQYEQAVEPLRKAVEHGAGTSAANQSMTMLMASYDELGRGGEALAMAEALHQANPQDKRALMNLVTLYGNEDMPDKAMALLDQARAQGMVTTADDYQRLFAAYYNLQREADAAALLQEGLDRKVLPANGTTYLNLVQAWYFGDNIPNAIAAGQAGLPFATDGKLALLLSQILSQEDRNSESIAAARQALEKGIEKPGEAWMVIARGEYYNDNMAAARAAFQEAAKDPSTRSQAQAELAKLNR